MSAPIRRAPLSSPHRARAATTAAAAAALPSGGSFRGMRAPAPDRDVQSPAAAALQPPAPPPAPVNATYSPEDEILRLQSAAAETHRQLSAVTAERDALAAQVQQLTFQLYNLRTRSAPNAHGVPLGGRAVAVIDARTGEARHGTAGEPGTF